MSEARKAREAAMPMEAKKDSLRQTQDGLWKVTFTVKPEDMRVDLLNAHMGTRYQLALVEIGDDEEAVQREKSPGAKAKAHFEAACQDAEFQEWLYTKLPPEHTITDARALTKDLMGIESANELIADPEPWHRLWNEYRYRNVRG